MWQVADRLTLLSREGNYLDLDPVVKDPMGFQENPHHGGVRRAEP